jgi:hypothetical protein
MCNLYNITTKSGGHHCPLPGTEPIRQQPASYARRVSPDSDHIADEPTRFKRANSGILRREPHDL